MDEILVAATGLALRFPDAFAEARARAEEFRRLTPEGRWREITALMALGLNMAHTSPRHDAITRRWEAEEAEWQRRQKELAEHVR
jgi:hypothetical protein